MKKAVFTAFCLSVFVGLLSLVSVADASTGPAAQLQKTVSDIQKVICGAPTITEAQKSAVRQLIFERIDMADVSRRTLGKHYAAHKDRFPEFVRLFGGLIEKNWMNRASGIAGAKIEFERERLDGDLATVESKLVMGRGGEISVGFRLHRAGNQWLVHDILVEGISLVSSYRAQFNRVIQQDSFDELISRLRAKDLGEETK